MKTAPPAGRYDAFISHSHAADGKLAPALRQALHQFGKPLFKLRALNAFRDAASPAGEAAKTGLHSSIRGSCVAKHKV